MTSDVTLTTQISDVTLTTQIHTFIQNNSLGDYASIIALLITLLGFGITLIQLSKTKKASNIATQAVNEMRHDLKLIDIFTVLSSVVTEMEEIKRLSRAKNISQLTEKYAKLRASIISIRTFDNIFTKDELAILQATIAQLSASEKSLDKYQEDLENNIETTFKFSRTNGIISSHIDKLNEVLIRIKSNIGTDNE